MSSNERTATVSSVIRRLDGIMPERAVAGIVLLVMMRRRTRLVARVMTGLLLVGLTAACSGTASGSSSPPAASNVPPSPTVTDEPNAAPSAMASTPASSPAASPSAPPEAGRFEVDLTTATAHTVTVKVVDWTGRVTAASSGTPGDGASVPYDQVVVTNDGPSALLVTWVNGPCDGANSLVLDGSTVTVIQKPCVGDAIGFDRIVRLAFDGSIDATSFSGVLQTGVDTSG